VTDLSAYRIIQEALTNVIRHAGPAKAAVLVEYAPDSLTIEVTDTGGGLPSSAAEAAFAQFLAAGTGAGQGLRGMRERAAAAGGTIEIGPRPGRGFRVAARFPLDPESAEPAPPVPSDEADEADEVASGHRGGR
jgi:signal transduction histidine kinase